MPQFPITTRPERTSDDIAADRKAANAFFARYTTTDSPRTQRDRDALLRFYSYDWNLICCVIEATEWARIHADDSAAHRAARRAERAAEAALNDIPARVDSRLRPYVHAATMKRMPTPGVTRRPVSERLTARGQADRFWALCQNPTAKFRAAVLNDADQPFSQWLLLHPGYGPLQDAPDGYAGTLRLPKSQRFVPGSVRPAGISYDRALEIALAALDNTSH
ncbi:MULTISPECIES: hypothetical protein [Cryobacterium]|uniref:Uncharacterized protein n=2 Tax=Cryobacterium TaxID=69578 RepID=A0A4R9AWL8_9MICO|nr:MULTISPECIES: hypothetical protein [Cryobacterium]TFD66288.1 hypothetical protein E3T47_07180 [Cryobacterium ruanii]TFD70645.1 hypothetical protein E3T50_08600 [Cryobacterium gelidum]